ncbi:MAG: hypothetical protein ABJD07_07540 [Gemmatimonadaceae bacterium]
MRLTRISAASVFVLLAACTDTTSPLLRLPTGPWGSVDVTFAAGASGATLTLICESGAITQPLVLDANGDFAWAGTARPSGNIIASVDHPALYSGHATRTSVTVTRTITDASGYAPWTHTLAFGEKHEITPCPLVVASVP